MPWSLPRVRRKVRRVCEQGEMSTVDRITSNPAVMGGKPCIRGMRITVGTVLGLLAAGHSDEEILQAYPYLEMEDLRACEETLPADGHEGLNPARG
jgi:uncharacterized protein (DUF433 family)